MHARPALKAQQDSNYCRTATPVARQHLQDAALQTPVGPNATVGRSATVGRVRSASVGCIDSSVGRSATVGRVRSASVGRALTVARSATANDARRQRDGNSPLHLNL